MLFMHLFIIICDIFFCIAFMTNDRAYLTYFSIKFFTIYLIWLLTIVKANIFKLLLKMTIIETFGSSKSPTIALPFYFAFEMH